MELNASLIYDRLKQKYPVRMYGQDVSRMCYSVPELYTDQTTRLQSGHLYLATAEHLQHRPMIEKDVLLVCIGENSRLSYYKEHATVILLRQKIDFFTVYHTLQDIFRLFQNWESALLSNFMKDPSVQDIVNSSYPVFCRPIFVLDASFQYIAATDTPADLSFSDDWQPSREELEPRAFFDYLKEQELIMDKRGAFLLHMNSIDVLCVNLFNKNDEYIGCLCINQLGRPLVEGEEQLAEYLAAAIEKVSEINPVLLNSERNDLKSILQTMAGERPLSKSQKLRLQAANRKTEYYCMTIHYQKHASTLPVSYTCSLLESLFADSLFFSQDNTILGLVPAVSLPESEEERRPVLDRLQALAEELHLRAGISNSFQDLYLLRTYCRQAEAAIDNGQIYAPDRSVFFFTDFMLTEMITSALDGQPLESCFPRGFRALVAHDRNSSLSYLETLSVFLEENLSYTKAAKRLFIHRSTLIERIERIEKELSRDLSDPDWRLLLQILLKAIQIENHMKAQ